MQNKLLDLTDRRINLGLNTASATCGLLQLPGLNSFAQGNHGPVLDRIVVILETLINQGLGPVVHQQADEDHRVHPDDGIVVADGFSDALTDRLRQRLEVSGAGVGRTEETLDLLAGLFHFLRCHVFVGHVEQRRIDQGDDLVGHVLGDGLGLDDLRFHKPLAMRGHGAQHDEQRADNGQKRSRQEIDHRRSSTQAGRGTLAKPGPPTSAHPKK